MDGRFKKAPTLEELMNGCAVSPRRPGEVPHVAQMEELGCQNRAPLSLSAKKSTIFPYDTWRAISAGSLGGKGSRGSKKLCGLCAT